MIEGQDKFCIFESVILLLQAIFSPRCMKDVSFCDVTLLSCAIQGSSTTLKQFLFSVITWSMFVAGFGEKDGYGHGSGEDDPLRSHTGRS